MVCTCVCMSVYGSIAREKEKLKKKGKMCMRIKASLEIEAAKNCCSEETRFRRKRVSPALCLGFLSGLFVRLPRVLLLLILEQNIGESLTAVYFPRVLRRVILLSSS